MLCITSFPELRLNEISWNIHPFFYVDSPSLHHLVVVRFQPCFSSQVSHLRLREEVAPRSILTCVEITRDLSPWLEPG